MVQTNVWFPAKFPQESEPGVSLMCVSRTFSEGNSQTHNERCPRVDKRPLGLGRVTGTKEKTVFFGD